MNEKGTINERLLNDGERARSLLSRKGTIFLVFVPARVSLEALGLAVRFEWEIGKEG